MQATVSNKRVLQLIVLILGTVFLAAAVGVACILWGYHGARQCAVDYPHDGQCGLVAMEGMAFALFAAPVTLIVGLVASIWRWKRVSKLASDLEYKATPVRSKNSS